MTASRLGQAYRGAETRDVLFELRRFRSAVLGRGGELYHFIVAKPERGTQEVSQGFVAGNNGIRAEMV